MSKYIKPTLTIVSNASGASSDPGPLSVALNLTAKPLLNRITINNIKSGVYDFANTTQVSLLTDATEVDVATVGTDGGYIYLKNTSPGDHDVYVGAEAAGAGPSAINGAGAAARLGVLKQGEFLYMPWDNEMDLTIQAEDATCTLEWWFFDRT